MEKHIQSIDKNFSISHGDELKTRSFYNNTIREYQVGSYLQKLNDYKDHLTLHLDFVQSSGDFSLGTEGFELKENAGALKWGYLSFEVMNTRDIKPSGVMASQQFGVRNYIMYLPEKNWSNDRYKKFKHQLHIFDTKALWQWLIRQEYITAKNNNYVYSNALCYQVPIKYLSDNTKFQALIKQSYTVSEDELNSFGTPEGLDNYFVQI
jgi:hypothetical protein